MCITFWRVPPSKTITFVDLEKGTATKGYYFVSTQLFIIYSVSIKYFTHLTYSPSFVYILLTLPNNPLKCSPKGQLISHSKCCCKLVLIINARLWGKFDDTKKKRGVITSRKSKRQYNGKKKKDKMTNNNLQNITQKTKDRTPRTPIKTGCAP